MKSLLLSFFLFYFFSTIVNGQTPLLFTDAVQTTDTNQTKDALYLKAKEWFVETFKSANDVIQIDDKASGMIQGKGNIKYTYNTNYNGYIHFTIKLWLKNGKYKYEFSNFTHESSAGNCFSLGLITDSDIIAKPCKSYGYMNTLDKAWTDIKNTIDIEVKKMTKSLNDEMNKKIDTGW